MVERTNGYFGLAIIGEEPPDMKALWRSAGILGAGFICIIGEWYKPQPDNIARDVGHIPMFRYTDINDFVEHRPQGAQLIAVEDTADSVPLQEFSHPDKCIYILRDEFGGIPKDFLCLCDDFVEIAGGYWYNIAVAGSLVMYDRFVKALK